jgi:very-short-patch-repair endonuclease
MTAYQKDFFGGSKRLDPWFDICVRKFRQHCPTPPFEKTECYKIIAGEIYADTPEMTQVLRGILRAGDINIGKGLIEAVFRSDSYPAPDTIARQLRKARDYLEERGELVWSENVNGRPSFDALLVKIEERSNDIDSSLEARFNVKLNARFEGRIKFLRPGYIENFTVDWLCSKYGLSIEVDGWEYHGDKLSFTSDRRKARTMQRLGYTHLQFSGSELSVNGGIERAIDEIEEIIQKKDSSKGHRIAL